MLAENEQKPIWSELDSLLDPQLFIGRSAEIVDNYVGPKGPVATQLEKYQAYITSTKTATLSV